MWESIKNKFRRNKHIEEEQKIEMQSKEDGNNDVSLSEQKDMIVQYAK